MSDKELFVETPWGKLITSKGLETLLTGFSNDLDKLASKITQIEARISEIENLRSNKNVNSHFQALEGSLKSLEEDVHELQKNQSRFAAHMKKTLELFYGQLDEIKKDREDHNSKNPEKEITGFH